MKWRALQIGAACFWLGFAPAPRLHGADPAPANGVRTPRTESRVAEVSVQGVAEESIRLVRRVAGQDIVTSGENLTVEESETVGSVVVFAGDLRLDGQARDVVVLGGNATINGTITGDLVVVLGGATFGPTARVRKESVVVGGPVKLAPGARLEGKKSFHSLAPITGGFVRLKEWAGQGLVLARPMPPRLPWVWVMGGVALLFCLGLAFVFPRPVLASIEALRTRPAGSFFSGLMVMILSGPLLFVLFVSFIGWVAIPFVLLALFLAAVFGHMAFGSVLGLQLTRQFSSLERKLPLLLAVGTAVLYLLYMVPVLGFLALGLAVVTGMGAATLAAFGGLRGEGVAPVDAAPPVLIASRTAFSGAAAASPPEITADVLVLARVGFWRRLIATALDFLLFSLLIPITGAFFPLVWVAYHCGMWAWKGTTIGGIVMGLKIVRLNGAPLDFPVALVRSLCSFFSGLALFLGFFWAGWDRERQSWHDKLAGTLVVRVPRSMVLS